MNDKAFFDTNVLVYIIGQREKRTETAENLLAKGGVVSVQVLNELASVSRRKLRMTWKEVDEALAAIRILCPHPIPITVEIHDAALQIAFRYGYHIYDALIIASALQANCATIYSEDLQHEQNIEKRLKICNPFIIGKNNL
jgi:predicted nucleic acid-binding protein